MKSIVEPPKYPAGSTEESRAADDAKFAKQRKDAMRDEFARLIAPTLAVAFVEAMTSAGQDAERMPRLYSGLVYVMADSLVKTRQKFIDQELP